MYIAGRLRTASNPPNTLIDVASYLCPGAAAVPCFSLMTWTSPRIFLRESEWRARRHRLCPLAPHASWGSKGAFCPHPDPHRVTRRNCGEGGSKCLTFGRFLCAVQRHNFTRIPAQNTSRKCAPQRRIPLIYSNLTEV